MKLLGIIALTIFSMVLVTGISKDGTHAVTLISAGVAILFYTLPTFIAFHKKHHNKTPIMLLNIFLGWTFIGWVIALIWANAKPRVQAV